jgi:alginate lyase
MEIVLKASIVIGMHLLFVAPPSYGADLMPASEARLFSCILVPESTIKTLQETYKKRQGNKYNEIQALLKLADQNTDRIPNVPNIWYVPGFYRDAEGHRKAKNGLRDDANTAYALALCYRITGEEKYAQSATRIINAWTTKIEDWSLKDDSMLSFSYHFPAMIFAADLLRNEDVWREGQQKVFETFLRNKVLPMSTIDRSNNWGNWGLVLSVSCAAYSRDKVLFDKCVERWKYFIDHQIAGDGHLPHEVKRSGGKSGIWYSHFCLMPQTIAAEILKNNGADLFDYVSPKGHALKQAFERIAVWTERPETFPYWKGDAKELTGVRYFSYFEILNGRWPNEVAARLLSMSRPMSANHSAPFLTLTHEKSLE